MIDNKAYQIDFHKYLEAAQNQSLNLDMGKISRMIGQVLEGFLPDAVTGSLCQIEPRHGASFLAEVVGFRDTPR